MTDPLKQPCPWCGRVPKMKIPAIDVEMRKRIKPGAVGICFACLGFCIVVDDNGKQEKLTDELFIKQPANVRAELLSARMIYRGMMKR